METILYIVGGIISTVILVGIWNHYTNPVGIELRRKKEEEYKIATQQREYLERIEKERVQQQRESERQRAREATINQYRLIRKEIEQMPRYQTWRSEILQRHGSKCSVCGVTENIEVDHYPISMYQLVLSSGILNINDPNERLVRAYEFTPFWDINNGAPLCKDHHLMTKSSKTYIELSSQRQ